MKLDLNCDLGEGEPASRTAALLENITSANIACGGHAGDLQTMRTAVQLALRHKVRIGAHPGLPDRDSFGRTEIEPDQRAFELLLVHQVGALDSVVRALGGQLHHVKLHGALYHIVERSERLRRIYLKVIAEIWPGVVVFARAGGLVVRDATEASINVWPEGFLDRAYNPDGTLVNRAEPNALLPPEQFEHRLRDLRAAGPVRDLNGNPVQVRARTWCIHGDGRDAVAFARLARETLLTKKP